MRLVQWRVCGVVREGGRGGRGRRNPLWWAVFRSCKHLWTGALVQGLHSPSLHSPSTRMGVPKTAAHMRSVNPSTSASRRRGKADPRGTVVKTVRKTLETSRQTPTTLSPTAPTREAPSAPARSTTALERSASKNQGRKEALAQRGAARATTVRGVEYRTVPGTSKGKGRTSAVLGASHRARTESRSMAVAV